MRRELSFVAVFVEIACVTRKKKKWPALRVFPMKKEPFWEVSFLIDTFPLVYITPVTKRVGTCVVFVFFLCFDMMGWALRVMATITMYAFGCLSLSRMKVGLNAAKCVSPIFLINLFLIIYVACFSSHASWTFDTSSTHFIFSFCGASH